MGVLKGLGFDSTGQRQGGDGQPELGAYWPHLTSKLPQPHRHRQETRRTRRSQHSRQPGVSSIPVPRARARVSAERPQTGRTQIFHSGLQAYLPFAPEGVVLSSSEAVGHGNTQAGESGAEAFSGLRRTVPTAGLVVGKQVPVGSLYFLLSSMRQSHGL